MARPKRQARYWRSHRMAVCVMLCPLFGRHRHNALMARTVNANHAASRIMNHPLLPCPCKRSIILDCIALLTRLRFGEERALYFWRGLLRSAARRAFGLSWAGDCLMIRDTFLSLSRRYLCRLTALPFAYIHDYAQRQVAKRRRHRGVRAGRGCLRGVQASQNSDTIANITLL